MTEFYIVFTYGRFQRNSPENDGLLSLWCDVNITSLHCYVRRLLRKRETLIVAGYGIMQMTNTQLS